MSCCKLSRSVILIYCSGMALWRKKVLYQTWLHIKKMEIMYYFNLLQIWGISLPYLSNWLYLSGRAALQKRIMALLRQLDRQTAGNVQVYVSIFHIFYLHYNCFHFTWTLPLADQVTALNFGDKILLCNLSNKQSRDVGIYSYQPLYW